MILYFVYTFFYLSAAVIAVIIAKRLAVIINKDLSSFKYNKIQYNSPIYLVRLNRNHC